MNYIFIAITVFLFFFGYKRQSTGPESINEPDFEFVNRYESGPKYWTSYEYMWENNQHIPESRWKNNIDWISANFKVYGYDMIANDGWIEGAQTINEYGYITKFSDSWTQNIQTWANYIESKGMKLGVYYNPMWLTAAAYNANVKVKGSSYRSQDIVGHTPFNGALYWVDVGKYGAKDWIQGYVYYWKEMGAKYLRIDFLENYECNYGTLKYDLALRWIREAAGNDLFLSLVMPNCYNHCKTELKYGDMIRISNDCFDGGWDFVSDRNRGQTRDVWPIYDNAFDGFIGFADIGGRGQMILDGDFMRLNTLANDQERIFQMSLFAITGSALAIADQFDTCDGCEWVYQNEEILDLHTQGLRAKPLSYDIHDAPNSSRWIGQLPNGDWIVGLFNRETNTQIRSIHLLDELGIENGEASNIRDLWRHQDLGPASMDYSIILKPYTCQILRVKSNTPPKFEAEKASLINGIKKDDVLPGFSGSGYVKNFESYESSVLFAIENDKSTEQVLQIRYATPVQEDASFSVYVNDNKAVDKIKSSITGNSWQTIETEVSLNLGVNYLRLQTDKGGKGKFYLDYIRLMQN
jgi:hypothetical protein